MKKLLAILIVSMLATASFAQKIGYIDSEEIMEKLPEYTEAQAEIDRFSQQWQDELEKKYAEIERLYKEYTASEVLLPEDTKKDKQQEIFDAERDAKEYRESKFGYNGDLFQLQTNKIKPIQDRIMRAVKVVAQKKKFAMVYDKAGDVTWLYTDPAYDLSDEVRKELGIEDEKNNNSTPGRPGTSGRTGG